MNNLIIRSETEKGWRAVEDLTREAFWNVYRPGCSEHYVVHTLRKDPDFVPELALVMEKDGILIGHVMFVRASILVDDGEVLPIMTFGPISIHPDYQRQGYGKHLLDFALDRASGMGVGAVCMEGNIAFYGTCGFSVASAQGVHYYAEPRDAEVPYFLLRELKPGFLDGLKAAGGGVYHTPQGYFVDDAAVEAFDSTFPPKQKRKLPTQLFD